MDDDDDDRKRVRDSPYDQALLIGVVTALGGLLLVAVIAIIVIMKLRHRRKVRHAYANSNQIFFIQ